MPFVSRENIDERMNDIRSPVLNRRRASFTSAHFTKGGRHVPVYDISPPVARTAVPTHRKSGGGEDTVNRGVPLATFVSQFREAHQGSVTPVATPAVISRPLVELTDQQIITATEARSRRHKRKSRSIQWSIVALTLVFALVGVALVGSVYWVGKGVLVRIVDVERGTEAIVDLAEGEEALKAAEYERAADAFRRAHARLGQAEEAIGFMGRAVSRLMSFIPGTGARFSSSERLLSAASALSKAGEHISRALAIVRPSHDGVVEALTERLALAGADLSAANNALRDVQRLLGDIDRSALTAGLASTVALLEEKVPPLQEMLNRFLEDRSHILALLGHDAPQSYLLLFQNSAEQRATGGFIGTIALLEVDRGEIRRLNSMNVFDVDGQLLERVVPPRPIQKISTAWSLHDVNWFFDFPTSAKNAAWFYEQSGGPTVDGVIAITPDLLVRLLGLLGPIELPEHGVTLRADNVLARLQQQVEVGYTQSLNQPKRIVGDLIPALRAKIDEANSATKAALGLLLLESFNDRTITAWLRDSETQQWVQEQGWNGSMYKTDSDYLAVVHSNINGFKTDAVIDDSIQHEVRIGGDGRIIDTVTVTRRHTGGNTGIAWWDKVNADYLRVYVPRGSVLISADGHTPERVEEALDYSAHGFISNADVVAVENTFRIDQSTGTHIFEESGKTVFANWVYVSPGRTVTVRYTYELPFRVNGAKGYTLTMQHQPGETEGSFTGFVTVDDSWNVKWTSEDLVLQEGSWVTKGSLLNDRVYGVVIE